MVATTVGWDATHNELPLAPKIGQASLYITGTPDIVATGQDLAAHPRCVRIDQSPTITGIDTTADVFDVEKGAITPAELGEVIRDAIHNYNTNARPGQRWPAVYASRSSSDGYNIHDCVNAMDAAGLGSQGIGLFIADWNGNLTQASVEVANSTGPYPVIGRQYYNAGHYDLDVYSVPWLQKVSGQMASVPPGQWLNASDWTWEAVILVGVGLDGKLHQFTFNPATGVWARNS